MVATVVSGLTNVSLVNNSTGFSVWKRDGTGGTPSAVSEVDVFVQGTGACSVKVSNQGVVLAYATGGVDLSATGTHVYIWVNMLAGGLMATRANNGLCICLSSDATLTTGSNYSFWAVDGSDTYPGGWVRYVIDVSKTRTTGAGTLNLAAVQHIGMYCDTRPNTAKFDNLVIDRIDYCVHGTGLRVYGTSTADDLFSDILAADQGTVGNKYGIVTSKEGVIYVRGAIDLGDELGTSSSTLTDVDKVVVFEAPKYYNGSSVVDAVSASFNALKFKGNGTGSTSITLGKKVGTGDTASGRSGLTIKQSTNAMSVDFDNGNVTTANVYGCSFQGVTGTIGWGTNTAHECMGNSFSACSRVDTGSAVVRNCNIINTASSTGSFLWQSGTNIKNSAFIANADGIEMTLTSNQDYSGLTFSGNTYDTHLNNGGTSISISKSNGSNPATQRSTGGGTITYVGSATTIKVVATTDTGTPIQSANVFLRTGAAGSLPYDATVTISNSGTTATVTHTGHGISTGDKIVIYGAAKNDNLGVHTVTVTDANTYTFTTAGSNSGADGGTIKAYFVFLAGLTDVNGEISASRVYPADQSATGTARKSTSAPYYKAASINTTVSSSVNVSAAAVMISDD